MPLKTRTMNHVLICIENKSYNPRVLLKGAELARKNNYTFEVLFFYFPSSGCTVFNLLSIAESKNLSKRLGAIKFTLMRMESEQNAVKALVANAKDNKAREIVMSGAQLRSSSGSLFWRRVFSFDKVNYILKNMPGIILVLINHSVCNPFAKGKYKSGRKGYLLKGNDVKAPYTLHDKSFNKKDIAGLFFQMKDKDEGNGLFAFFRNGRVMYVHIRQGRMSIIDRV